MSELGIFYGGLSGKSKSDFTNGNAKFVTYMNVFSNIAIRMDLIGKVRVSDKENQNRIQYGDIIFTGSSETLGESGMSSVLTVKTDEALYLNSFCFGFRIKDDYANLLLPEFSKYLFRSNEMRTQIIGTANGVTRFNISKKKMGKIKIPIPPLAEQERIVSILDKFDTLVNSITEGLPKEIELRQKQYEYYREKLLTFKEIV